MGRPRWGTSVLAITVMVAFAGRAFPQTSTTGIIEGTVQDQQGKRLAGTTVEAQGPQGVRTTTTNSEGYFSLRDLPGGTYTLKAVLEGYATLVQTDLHVFAGLRTQASFALPSGVTEAVTVTATAPIVDMKSTTVGANITIKNFVEYIPLGRNFTSVFTLSPGVVGDQQSGAGNYSVSGSSGLENSYLVDGVNITNSGYGGIGSYNRVYGSLGSGVTTEFIEQVEIKEGGFEAEFGQATGGVVNAVVKGGTNEFSGQLSGSHQSASLEATRTQEVIAPDAIVITEEKNTDLALSAGGSIVQDRLFWFGAYNPVKTTTTFRRDVTDLSALECDDPATPATEFCDPNQTTTGRTEERERTNDSYAAKFSWNMATNHRLELTAFGDPSEGKLGPQRETSLRRVGAEGFSKLDYGGNNYALKYGGAILSNLFIDAIVARHESELKESAEEIYNIFDTSIPGGLSTGGLGFSPDTEETVDQYGLKVTWVVGPVELKAGYQQDDIEYFEAGKQTGPLWTAPLPIATFVQICSGDFTTACTTDAECAVAGGSCISSPRWDQTVGPASDGYFPFLSTTGAFLEFALSDPNDPSSGVYNVSRSRFSPLAVTTKNKEKNWFAQATWTIGPRVTVKAGVRYTDEFVAGGSPFSLPFRVVRVSTAENAATGLSRRRLVDPTQTTQLDPTALRFPKEWAPRVGVTWDVLGDGKHKVYANYGEYVQRITQDLAYRAFSNEVDISQNFLDAALTQPLNGDSCPTVTGNQPCQGILAATGLGGPTTVWPGSKLPNTEEFLIGYSREITRDIGIDLRYIHREIGRVLEDFSYVPQEAISNTLWGLDNLFCNPLTDPGCATPIAGPFSPFPAFGQDDFGDYVLGNIGENTGDAIATLGGGGYSDFQVPKRDYDAFEVVFNRRFTNNWLMWASYRWAKLRGNYEGLLRNDNGQDDPNITSLYDFPDTTLMRGQFLDGPLNLDVTHNLKLYSSYQFPNGFDVGGALRWT